MPSSQRLFPPPWTAELTPNCYIVRDADGQQLAYVYYENEPGRRSAAKPLSEDEARIFLLKIQFCDRYHGNSHPFLSKIASVGLAGQIIGLL